MDATSRLRAGRWQSHSICTQWGGGKDSEGYSDRPVEVQADDC